MRFLTAATFALTLLLILAQAAFAVRGMIDPAGGAVGFGYPVDGPPASFYHAIYRDRNLVISVIGLAFLVLRMWRALAIVLIACVTLPVYDIFALWRAGMPVLPLHYVTLAALVVVSGLAIACAVSTRR